MFLFYKQYKCLNTWSFFKNSTALPITRSYQEHLLNYKEILPAAQCHPRQMPFKGRSFFVPQQCKQIVNPGLDAAVNVTMQ